MEKILAKRKRNGRVEFLVKWKGFDTDENSWEPKMNLIDCDSAIKEYNKNEKDIKKAFSKKRVFKQNLLCNKHCTLICLWSKIND